MRTTSQTWKDIVANGEFDMESVARIYGATGDDTNGVAGSDSRGGYKEYGTITAPVITRSLLSGDALSVGNAIAGQLKFTIMTTDTIPKSAMIVIRARVKKGSSVSEWLEFGTFWLDHRTVTDNLTDIEAYDAMKKGNQTYADNSQALVWPKTIKVVVQRIAEQMGIAIDSRTIADVINAEVGNLNIITKPTDDMSLLNILGNIGGILGGNWIITDENKLRFVQLTSPVEIKGYLLDHEQNIVTTDAGNRLLWHGESEEDSEDTDEIDVIDIPVVISTLNTASKYTVSKVTIGYDSEHVYSVGSDTGYEIIQSNNPYATQALAELMYSRINGVTYAPFESTGCIYDPAVEMGDGVVIGTDISSIMYNETRTLNVGFSADVAAPGRDEMEDEYPYQTFEQKTKYIVESLNHDIVQNRTSIEQTQEKVAIIAEGVSDEDGNISVRSAFEIDKKDITLSAGVDEHGHAIGKITFNSGTVEINSTNFTLTDTGVITCSAGNIGGIHISSSGIYSGSKVNYLDSHTGFSLGSDGTLGIGDNTNYIRFDGSDVAIKVENLAWTATNSSMTADGTFACTAGNIGGIHITSDSLYSGSKSSYNSYQSGFYLGSDGSLGIGDNTNYIRFYKPDPDESDYNLEINVDKLSWTATNSSMTADGTLTCTGANLNGKITSTTSPDSPDQYKTEINNGAINFYLNGALYGTTGFVGMGGTNVFGIKYAGSGTSVMLDATVLDSQGALTGQGSYVRVFRNGDVDICGTIYVKTNPTALGVKSDTGYFLDQQGNHIEVVNGIIVNGLIHN